MRKHQFFSLADILEQVRMEQLASDDFCLYYVIDKNKDDDRIEILGFYSLYFNDFSEHIGENKEIKSILIGQHNLDEDDFTKAVVDLYEF